jgi:hypothetical protein
MFFFSLFFYENFLQSLSSLGHPSAEILLGKLTMLSICFSEYSEYLMSFKIISTVGKNRLIFTGLVKSFT